MTDMICRQKKSTVAIRILTTDHTNTRDTPKQQFH